MGEQRRPVTGYPVMTHDELIAFYRAAVTPVYRTASRLVGGDRQRAEDLVQEAFTGLVREIRDGRITHVDIGWLIVAVRHRFIDAVRRAEREQRRLQLVAGQPERNVDPLDTASRDEVASALAQLTDAHRAVLVLHHVEGVPVAELAGLFGKSPRALESTLARARHRLRTILVHGQEGADD